MAFLTSTQTYVCQRKNKTNNNRQKSLFQNHVKAYYMCVYIAIQRPLNAFKNLQNLFLKQIRGQTTGPKPGQTSRKWLKKLSWAKVAWTQGCNCRLMCAGATAGKENRGINIKKNKVFLIFDRSFLWFLFVFPWFLVARASAWSQFAVYHDPSGCHRCACKAHCLFRVFALFCWSGQRLTGRL